VSGYLTTFAERMSGDVLLAGERAPRAAHFTLSVEVPGVFRPWRDMLASVRGRLVIAGLVDSGCSGRMRIAPLAARRIRYQLDVDRTGARSLHLDGWKRISARRPWASLTRLPITLTDEAGRQVASGEVRFAGRDLPRFLLSFRYRRRRPQWTSPS
jgi:hypothetical protein